MLAGELYAPSDPELQAELTGTAEWLARLNRSGAEPSDTIRGILAAGLRAIGSGSLIRPPFYCDYGYNISLRDGVFINYNCVFLDVTSIIVGDRTQIGPAVQLYTADHPRDPVARRQGLEFGRSITIGADVWIGGGAIVLPGVSIGDGATIGAGSVVTRDVAPGVTVVGNPARPVRRRSSP